MSQENQNIQPGSNSPERESSSQQKQPFWKASLIKVLRGTIGVLETTAVKLETETPTDNQEKQSFLQKLQKSWSGILGKIRLILPAKFSAKLTDTALTGIMAGIVIIVFFITSNFWGSKASQVAKVSPDTAIQQVESTTTPEPIAPEGETVSLESQEDEVISPPEEEAAFEQEEVTVILPSEDEATSEQQEQIPTVVETQNNPSPEEETTSLTAQEEIESEIPAVVESQTNSSPEEETTPNPEIEIPSQLETPQEELENNPPQIPLTPEETLIAAIQNQVTEISDSEIIESIQVNFLDSNLTIKISNNWYSLEKSQQDKLAAEILQRSQELDFTHLEITDLQSNLIARNPVVGNEMIIFKR